jgi:hypothetical protein
MRSTDPDPQPFKPLGERATRQPTTSPPTSPKPTGPSGIVVGPDGRMKTTTH